MYILYNIVAYLTDAWDKGAIIVFDYTHRTSKRFTGISTSNDASYKMVINNINYGTHIFTTPTDGIALTEDYKSLFFCQVQGTTLYRIDTAFLRDNNGTTVEDMGLFDKAVVNMGYKEPSDGIKYSDGKLYWGALTQSTIYSMSVTATSTPNMNVDAVQLFPTDTDRMQWVDTFAIDNSATNGGVLYFVSNKLNLFTTHKMDFNVDGNMHIMR